MKPIDKKLEVKCLREYDDNKQRVSLPEFEKLLKTENLRMPTMDDLYWMWKQGTKIELKYRPFWVRMPAGPAVPGYADVGDFRFGASLGDDWFGGGRFGGVGVRDVKPHTHKFVKRKDKCAECGEEKE